MSAELQRAPADTEPGKGKAIAGAAALAISNRRFVQRLSAWIAWLAIAAAPALVRAQHDMSRMGMTTAVPLPLDIPWTRVTSGTAWLPDDSPMYALGGARAGWMWMLHGAAFGQFDRQGTSRGETQVGLVDWEMGMVARPLFGGVLRANVMTSLQSLVLGDSGYPQLLQTGGSLNGSRLANRQHPHALVGELAGIYERSLTSRIAVSAYVAAVGEPAVGPVSFMHRPSAWDDPFAPLGHHQQDATDAANGVATLGVYGRRVKLEGSMFNARESTRGGVGIDYTGARLDSYSGRLTVAATERVVTSAWAAYLYGHDPLSDPIGMQRYGASLLLVSRERDGRVWSNSIVWGFDVHHHGSRHHAHTDGLTKAYNLMPSVTIESAFEVTRRATIFARAEQVAKSADDLGFVGGDLSQTFTVLSVSAGGTHALLSGRYGSLSLGVRGTLNMLTSELKPVYGTNTPMGFAAFLRLRPGPASP